LKNGKLLLLNPFTTARFSKDGRCQTESGAWLDTFPPVMLPSIAGLARRKHRTKLVDCVGERRPFVKALPEVEEFSPDLTVVNTSISSLAEDLEAGHVVKERTGSRIAVYGEHCTFEYKAVLKRFPFVDYVIRGEAETPVVRIMEGDERAAGVATRKHAAGIWREPDLDVLPFPAYDMLPDYRFPLTGERWAWIRSGRGCPNRCMFCSVPSLYGTRPRFHSVDYMIRQLDWVVNGLGIKLGMFWDDTHTLDRRRTLELSKRLVESGLSKNFSYLCTTRADKVDDAVMKGLKASGCRMIAFGLESGSQKVLDASKKNLKLKDSINAVKLARKYDIASVGHFILGLPGSDEAEDMKTIKFSDGVGIDFAQFYTAAPFAGCGLNELAKKKGWLTAVRGGSVQHNTMLSYLEYTADRIGRMRELAYRTFYTSPNRLRSAGSYMRLLRYPHNIIRSALKAGSFAGWAFR